MKEVNDAQPSTSTSSRDANRPQNEQTSTRKRRASSATDTEVSAKRFVAHEEDEDDDGVFKLLDFTDEVLLEILQNCDCTTLYALSKTCKHFLKLVEDRRLWKTFDFATKRLMGKQIKKLLSALQIGDIKECRVRGFVSKYPHEKWKNNTITVNILRKLASSCPRLETMEIREGYINLQQLTISDFPPTLKRLIFNGCQTPVPRSPRLFSKIDEYIQLLEEISLEKCAWFETHDLVVFSKLPHLKRLILRGCSSLKGCVPYGSIATRFGFKNLEYLDVRDTPISDSDIQCFNITTTLREILMDCPVECRESYATTDEAISDTDDSEAYESKPCNNNDSSQEQNSRSDQEEKESTKSANRSSTQGQHDDSMASDTESESSESDIESDCSSDSEDDGGDDKDENGAAAKVAKHDDTNSPHQAHCIQVILQNGRMINVNAGRSNDFDNPMRETDGLRCVIGIINGRDSNESLASSHRIFTAPLRYQRQAAANPPADQAAGAPAEPSNSPIVKIITHSRKPGESLLKCRQQPGPADRESAGSSSSSTSSDGSFNQPGPSGLQSNNQNDSSKSPKSNSNSNPNPDNGNNDGHGSNQNITSAQSPPPANESRQRLIIVQHRRQANNNDENGNGNRQVAWEVRNLYQMADAPYRQVRYQNTVYNGIGNYITDRGLCSFGMPRRNVQDGIIWIRAELRPPDTLLERITVRNYCDVTDITLRHLALCAPNLRYLDVSGTSVTWKGIQTFLKEKPECQVISELLDT